MAGGNVREMENAMQRSLVLAHRDRITLERIPMTLRAEGDILYPSILWQEGTSRQRVLIGARQVYLTLRLSRRFFPSSPQRE